MQKEQIKLNSIYILQTLSTSLHSFQNPLPPYPMFFSITIFGIGWSIMQPAPALISASCLSMMQIFCSAEQPCNNLPPPSYGKGPGNEVGGEGWSK